jgi:hypothetical protein
VTRANRHDHRMPYADEDLGEVDASLFTQEPAPDGGGVIVAGTCPRCHGATRTLFPWARPGTGTKGGLSLLFGRGMTRRAEDGSEPLLAEVHLCECGHAHPHVPPDTRFLGCGAIWRIRR